MRRELKRTDGFTLFVILVIVCDVINAQNNIQVKVRLVVENTEMMAGKRALATIDIALSDFYAQNQHYKTRLLIHTRSSRRHVFTSAEAVLDLIKNVEVEAIIGPETSMEAHFDISIGDKAHVPLISYSASSHFLSFIESDFFIQATQVDVAQVQAISSIIQAFEWRQIVPIYVDNEFGGALIPILTDELQRLGTRITNRSVISSSATDDQIVAELNNLKSMATRVFIVHMETRLSVRVFSIAKNLGMMSQDYVWIVTNEIGDRLSLLTPKNIIDMQGVIGVKTYFQHTKEVEEFVFRLKRKIIEENQDVVDPQVSVFELWVYDAITALAMAIEQVSDKGFKFEDSNTSSTPSSTDFSTLGVSQAGQKLIHALRGIRFTGLSGDFKLIDGQMQSSTLEIINVIGKGEKTLGVWTPTNGFLKEMNVSNDETYSISKERLGSIIWPGDTKDQPKGWIIPTNGNKLRVLVPPGSPDAFVKVEHVAGSGIEIKGYCIDIFDAVIKSLPYSLPYEYVPFIKPDGDSIGSYDEMISEVHYKRYDALVGDVTITSNRSLFVDLTLPFTESGIVLITPIKNYSKFSWVFVRPLSLELWATSLCYFVHFALIIWVLEHDNPDFQRVDTSLFYAFSTMVFAQSEKVSSKLARCVVIIWLFFVLILTSSYTASLTSMLTVQRLEQPTVADLNELKQMGKAVGYRKASFIKGFLMQKQIRNLKAFNSSEELDYLLTIGSENGGIAAAVDETSYMKFFLSQHCAKYTMVTLPQNSAGFGFVFPLGSPLLADISRQVLNVTEGDQMAEIKTKWLDRRETSCYDSLGTSIASSSGLRLHSFLELFIIVGLVVVCALIVFFIRYIYANPDLSYWDRVKNLARILYHRKQA